jgi:hypothetical protein
LRNAEADAGSRAGNDCCFSLQSHSYHPQTKLEASLVLPEPGVAMPISVLATA